MIRSLTPTLIVADLEASLEFWGALPGFRVSFHTPPDWAELRLDTGERLALRRGKSSWAGDGGSVGLRGNPDLERQLRELGARTRATEHIGGQRIVWYEGPDGSRFYLWGPERSRD